MCVCVADVCFSVSWQCVPLHGHGFVLDKYSCRCRAGFYHPNRVALNSFTGESGTRPSPVPMGAGHFLTRQKGKLKHATLEVLVFGPFTVKVQSVEYEPSEQTVD